MLDQADRVASFNKRTILLMKRRKFIKAAGTSALVTATGAISLANTTKTMAEPQQILELRVYTFKFRGNQKAMHDYLQKALIPAYNRYGVTNVGVFMELGESEPAKLYLLIPHNSFEEMDSISRKLSKDLEYGIAAEKFEKLPADTPVYSRYDTYLMKAFSGLPKVEVPAKEERIFELRTYEGYNEDAVRRKVLMFNAEELPLFYELKLNPVFFGHIMSGPKMPALMYMLSFDSMESRNKAWGKFFNHPEWNRMKALPKYANTVSNIHRVFLKPVEYSQI